MTKRKIFLNLLFTRVVATQKISKIQGREDTKVI
jgi:hypothetical protein